MHSSVIYILSETKENKLPRDMSILMQYNTITWSYINIICTYKNQYLICIFYILLLWDYQFDYRRK